MNPPSGPLVTGDGLCHVEFHGSPEDARNWFVGSADVKNAVQKPPVLPSAQAMARFRCWFCGPPLCQRAGFEPAPLLMPVPRDSLRPSQFSVKMPPLPSGVGLQISGRDSLARSAWCLEGRGARNRATVSFPADEHGICLPSRLCVPTKPGGCPNNIHRSRRNMTQLLSKASDAIVLTNPGRTMR